MMKGCLRNVFALVGCLTLLVLGSLAAWQYRAQLAGLYRSFVSGSEPVADSVPGRTGRASEAALVSARRKRAAMERGDGPAYIVLTAEEMASLVVDGLVPAARGSLDTVDVTLDADRFTLQARLRTRIFTDELLGPFAGVLDAQEPVRIAGPARLGGSGVVAWEPDAFTIRQFPFPASAVPRLMNHLTGREDGAVPIAVPATVGDVRIRPDGVTFYRRID